jgi:hypothetical protein
LVKFIPLHSKVGTRLHVVKSHCIMHDFLKQRKPQQMST